MTDRRGVGTLTSAKEGDQKDGKILLTTNPKERGYKEGTGRAARKWPRRRPEVQGKAEGRAERRRRRQRSGRFVDKAKVQINLKQTDKAKATLDEIVSKYPDSKQAADAKKLLEKTREVKNYLGP